MTTLKDRLREDLTAAMRARDEVSKSTLRMLMTAISKAEVAGKEHVELGEEQVIGLVRSELGKRNEAAGIYDRAGRTELAERERSEAAVLSSYLPPELEDAALEAVVAEEVTNVRQAGQDGPRAMGAVIKAVRARVGTQAEGGRIAAAVKKALG